jgi:hypothetical protein
MLRLDEETANLLDARAANAAADLANQPGFQRGTLVRVGCGGGGLCRLCARTACSMAVRVDV